MGPEVEPTKDGEPEPQELPLRPIETLLSTNCFVDRYFSRFYTEQKAAVSQYLYLHTNGIVVVGITESQIAPHKQEKVSLSYDCLTNNISDIVKGKKKSKLPV